MKRYTLILAAAFIALVAGSVLRAQPNNLESIMREKLQKAQTILDGVATEDFEKIKASADRLDTLTQMAEWQVFKSPEYVRQSENFRAAVRKLSADAKAKNLDAASLDYVEMTLSCVACHKAIRAGGIQKPL